MARVRDADADRCWVRGKPVLVSASSRAYPQHRPALRHLQALSLDLQRWRQQRADVSANVLNDDNADDRVSQSVRVGIYSARGLRLVRILLTVRAGAFVKPSLNGIFTTTQVGPILHGSGVEPEPLFSLLLRYSLATRQLTAIYSSRWKVISIATKGSCK